MAKAKPTPKSTITEAMKKARFMSPEDAADAVLTALKYAGYRVRKG